MTTPRNFSLGLELPLTSSASSGAAPATVAAAAAAANKESSKKWRRFIEFMMRFPPGMCADRSGDLLKFFRGNVPFASLASAHFVCQRGGFNREGFNRNRWRYSDARRVVWRCEPPAAGLP